jgi:hypothetical protein
MRHSLALIAVLVFFACSGVHSVAGDATRGFPSVKDIEAALNLHPGARIAQDLLIRGEHYRAEYVGAQQSSDGRYAIFLRLER